MKYISDNFSERYAVNVSGYKNGMYQPNDNSNVFDLKLLQYCSGYNEFNKKMLQSYLDEINSKITLTHFEIEDQDKNNYLTYISGSVEMPPDTTHFSRSDFYNYDKDTYRIRKYSKASGMWFNLTLGLNDNLENLKLQEFNSQNYFESCITQSLELNIFSNSPKDLQRLIDTLNKGD